MNERKRGKKRQLYISVRRYQWPNPVASEEQRRKFLGLDINNMTLLQRWQEMKRLENVAAWLEEDEVLFYTPTRSITKLSWTAERIKKLKRSGKGVKTT